MKFVQRSERPAVWGSRADRATESALADGATHRADSAVYGAPEVRRALLECFHDKCAYCETRFTRPPDIEHFRPKGRVEGITRTRADGSVEKHPGYYWLTYEWSNLYPVCAGCHQKRVDPDAPRLGGQGKGALFPLFDESTRAWGPEDDVSAEQRMLLSPCEDEPEEHLELHLSGELQPVDGSEIGRETIALLVLNGRLLRESRARVLREYARAAKAADDERLRELLSQDAPYSGLLQQFHRRLTKRTSP